MVKIRLDPQDEYMHPLEDATNFNESMYFNVYDPQRRVGGFLRLGNRANEGYAELTTCCYLPDGRVAFMFKRPEIAHNDAFDAGGMRFEVVTPFEELRTTYAGKVTLLDDPLQMADPRSAFTENPWVDAHIELVHRGVSPMYGGEPVNDDGTPLSEDHSGGFARGHYEQHMSVSGVIRVGDEEWPVDGFGLRDHSWGPRYWQAPWYYRWLTANFGDDFGFVVSVVTSRDGRERVGGMVLRDGAYEHIESASISTVWKGDDCYHHELRATARTGARSYEISGRVLNLIPLRNRRTTPDGEQLVTRISEGLTEWSCDGRTGYGLSEYLDQIVDGRPVGASA
ncbi:MAG: hypothetical protein KatS3mg010_0480 [Acidimicrobiia bacterium]|nr:MAG: hypothetical protein KatS3mg010_0480 [Acidimicrobiia bacterium]